MQIVLKAATILVGILIGSSALAQSCVDDLSEDIKVTDFGVLVRCIKAIGQENVDLRAKLDAEREPTVIPAGAVVAFDIENSCPVGWASYRKLGGRMIVGSGDNFNRDQNGERLKEYSFGESGGAETHLMSVEEMPAHKHPGAAVFNDTYLARFRTEGKRGGNPNIGTFSLRAGQWTPYYKTGNNSGSVGYHISFYLATAERNLGVETEIVGGGQPHNNMPPFLALRYCKKQ